VTTAFVLSGGGSLGAVQVGMLHALRERGVRPDLLVGTSAGAVNALWVAHHGMSVGSLNRLAGIWTRLRRKDVFPVRPKAVAHGIVGRASAVLSSDRLGALVEAHAGIGDLGDADIPVHLLATDLLSGGCVAISVGPVGDAVRASAAIPGVFPPVWLDGRWLVDGAMAANAGVSQAVRLGATVVYVLPTGVPARWLARRARPSGWRCTPCRCWSNSGSSTRSATRPRRPWSSWCHRSARCPSRPPTSVTPMS
jgi:NTE family protein